jgi:hypothetical protein
MKKLQHINNSIGMFDLFKGVAMIMIALAHTTGLFQIDISEARFSILFILAAVIEAGKGFLMPVFFIIFGYGLRKRSVVRATAGQFRDMVIPYLLTALITIVLNFVFHYAFFRYIPGAVSETVQLLYGELYGTSETVTLFGKTFFACGPIWFLLALFWAVCIFNVLLSFFSDNVLPFAVCTVSVIGWGIGCLAAVPWCFSQGMVGVLYVYFGYYLKRKKALNLPLDYKAVIFSIIIVVSELLLAVFRLSGNIADKDYPLGPISYIINGLFGIVILYMAVRVNLIKGVFSDAIKTVGGYSLYFLCIHSIEMIAFPWYMVAERFSDRQMLGIAVIFSSRLIVIFIGCFVLVAVKRRIWASKSRGEKNNERRRSN